MTTESKVTAAVGRKLRVTGLFVAAGATLAACGGGGGDSAAAPTCPALKSGPYRVITPRFAGSLATEVSTLDLNATTLTTTDASGTTQWTADANCQFSSSGGDDQIVVSQSSVIVGRTRDNSASPYQPVIAIPEQATSTFTAAELAGTWNTLGFERGGSAFTSASTRVTVDTNGDVTAYEECAGAVCTPVSVPGLKLTPNVAGGFDYGTGPADTDRVFIYKAPSGDLMGVGVSGNGSFAVLTKDRTLTQPAPTTSFQTNWTQAVSTQLVAAGVTQTSLRIDGPASANTFTRTVQTPGLTDIHSETIAINDPRNGFQHRPAATNNGVSYPEWTLLNLRGMNMSVLTFPATNRYMFSVVQP
jgi:hypothetical protein